MVRRVGLVCDETVVWDHDGGCEDRRGNKDGIAVDLLHGECRRNNRLLQSVNGLGDARVALRRLGGHTTSGNQRLHWLVQEHS